jgi:hypothetical protein
MLSSFTVNHRIVALLIFPQLQKQNTKSKTAMLHSPDAMAPGMRTQNDSLRHQKKGHSCQTSLSRLRDFQRKLWFPRVCVGRERGFTLSTTEKTKVNSVNYMKLLDNGLLQDCRNLYPWGRLHFSAGWSHISYK